DHMHAIYSMSALPAGGAWSWPSRHAASHLLWEMSLRSGINARHHEFLTILRVYPAALRIPAHCRSNSGECVSMIQETSRRAISFVAPPNTSVSPPSTSILTTQGPSRPTANESSVQWVSSWWSLRYLFTRVVL